MTDEFVTPDIRLGDSVYWYSDPMNLQNPAIGWVSERPGTRTISILVFAPGTGFIEKQSVRYKDDPGLRENPAWRQAGCWDYSEEKKDLMRARQVSASLAMTHERESRKPSPNGAK